MNSFTDMPRSSAFLSRPATRGGQWSGWLALTAIGAMLVTLILNENFEREGGAVFEVMRLLPIGLSIASGVGALVLSLRALFAGRERSIVVCSYQRPKPTSSGFCILKPFE